MTSNNMSGCELPEEYLETNYINRMEIGDVGWVTPWTMVVSEDHRCYINGNATLNSSPGGTVVLKVVKNKDGYYAFLLTRDRYAKEYKWKADGQNNAFGVKFDPIPLKSFGEI